MTGFIPLSLVNCSQLTSIYAGGNQFQGDIPASLGALLGFKYLDMSYNLLSGSIPTSLGNCSSLLLQDLNSNTQMSGALPPEVSMLKKLQVLYLDEVPISGSISSLIGNLSSPVQCILFGNNLQGEVPDSMSQLQFLEVFSIKSALRVSGVIPLSIHNLTSLQVFQLIATNVSGQIPPNIGTLPNLYYLNFGQNDILTGVTPSSLANCSTLTYLAISFNPLMGAESFPPWIDSLTSMAGLDLSGINLHGELPQSMGKLFNLQLFYAAVNNLTGQLSSSLQNCTYLSDISLSANAFGGGIPPELGALRYIFRFLAADNHFKSPFPQVVSNWTQLIVFYVSENYLSGSIEAQTFAQLGNFTTFKLQSNYLEGRLPESLGNCSELSEIWGGENQFSGYIPAWLGNLTKFQVFVIQSNNFTGPIPVSFLTSNLQLSNLGLGDNRSVGTNPWEIGQLVKLTELWLHDNEFTGIVPISFGNCSQINLLDVSGNQLNGSIPGAAISQTSASLRYLNLPDNLFSGPWPTEFSNLTAIQYINVSFNTVSESIPLGLGQCNDLNMLDISMNNLTGGIPADLGSLEYLQTFNASFNNFTGPIPQHGVFNTNRINESSFLGNPGLCGPIGSGGIVLRECATTPANVSNHNGYCKGFSCPRVWVPVTVVSTLLMLRAILIIVGFKLGWIGSRGRNTAHEQPLLLNFGAVKFTEKDLLKTLEDPDRSNVIGVGARSIVKREAFLPGGEVYALITFVLKADDPNTCEDLISDQHTQLTKEANILAALRHKNIIKLLCFYSSSDHKALIVEYMSEGSLHKVLHENDECKFPWKKRLNLAVGVAQGLKYLHHDLVQPIIHGDLKPSNIFLDANLKPKIGDFGVSRFVGAHKEGMASASTICGTVGYMPPGILLSLTNFPIPYLLLPFFLVVTENQMIEFSFC